MILPRLKRKISGLVRKKFVVHKGKKIKLITNIKRRKLLGVNFILHNLSVEKKNKTYSRRFLEWGKQYESFISLVYVIRLNLRKKPTFKESYLSDIFYVKVNAF